MTFALGTVLFSIRLIESPTTRRFFAAGVFTGLAAFFGRNLGVYSLVAMGLTMLYLWVRGGQAPSLRRYGSYVGGIFLGYSPMFLMFALVPGFFRAFVDSILFILRLKSTNIPLPVPWPWLILPSLGSVVGEKALLTVFLHDLFLGVLLLALPLTYLLSLASHFFMRREDVKKNALLTASLFTGAVYMHYIFSRADIEHLSRGIHPLLLSVVALASLPKKTLRRTAALALAALFLGFSTYYTVVIESPFYKKSVGNGELYVQYPIRGEKIWMPWAEASMIGAIEGFVRQNVAPDEWLFLAPFIPTMYYILDRESPTRNIYFLFKASPEEEKEIISRLEDLRVRWAIVGDIPLDGRDELRFSRTHEMVWRYLHENYTLVALIPQAPDYVIIRRP